MEKNYNFGLIYKKYDKKKIIISSLVKGLIFGLVLMLVVAYFMGYRIYSVMGTSSMPYIKYGSIVIDYKVPLKELKVGDYITWSRNGGKSFVTHQIIEIDYNNNSITTSQTDYYHDEGEVPNPDAPITYKEFYGKVIATVPEMGNIMLSIQKLVRNGNTINVLGIMTIILTISAFYLFKSLLHKDYYTLKEY